MKYALLSTWDKHGLVEFARELYKTGYRLISTGGTRRVLEEAGLPVINVSDHTGFPEILDGRVKTLHPRIFGGILARRERPDDLHTLESHNIPLIDLVVVNLYPFEAKAREDLDERDLLEYIDIGGPSLVRAAAKNYPDVLVVVDPRDYPRVIEALQHDRVDLAFRRELALKAFAHTARYDAVIHETLSRLQGEEDPPECLIPTFRKLHPLRYGENPHQRAWAYQYRNPGFLAHVNPLWGKPLSYNNLVDLYAALRLTEEFLDQDPTCVIVKHTNPCGVAHGDTALEAYRRALEGDPVSAFGGIVSLNVPVSRELAEALNEMFLEIVAAPDFEEGAWEILTRKKNRRIVQVNYPLPHTLDYRVLGGDLLVQEEDRTVLDPSRLEVVAGQPPDEATIRDLTFAYTVVKHVKSNAIVVAHNLQVLGVGAGQMNRVRAVELALEQAGEKAHGAVLASDAFFPFPDSVERAARAGIRAVIQPGGSVRDEQVIQRARELGLTLIHTGVRHFRH